MYVICFVFLDKLIWIMLYAKPYRNVIIIMFLICSINSSGTTRQRLPNGLHGTWSSLYV